MIGVGHYKTTKTIRDNVKEVLDMGRLSYGKFTKQFEQDFAFIHERKYGVFCNSGTSALQVALHTLKIAHGYKDGDEVIVPALTFVATINIILQNNMKPVLVDIDEYYGLDPTKLKAAITPRTKVIIPVHIAGQMCDMQEIMNIAHTHKLKVIEDSCETMFASHRGKIAWSAISCYSTYVAHILTTGVGGFACTNNPEYAEIIRSLCNHGRDGIYISMEDNKKGKEVIKKRFKFDHVGYSYRATELEAAIGLAQLTTIRDEIEKRKENAAFLTEHLSKHDEIELPKIRPLTDHVFMFYPITIKGNKEQRTRLVEYLEAKGIETRYLLPLTNQPVYKGLFNEKDYPNAMRCNNSSFYIACHPGLTKADLLHIIKTFDTYYG